VSLAPIVAMLPAGGLEPYARIPALALYAGSLAAALALAGRLLAIRALDDRPALQWHPGYYLPSVGAPIVAAGEAAAFGWSTPARLPFGLGVISWVLIGGILLHHLVGQQRLPTPLIPTMAILIAPPVVAGNAWFAINGGRVDHVGLGLAGYALLMAIVQLGLILAYCTVPFGPGWWSFPFPFAATAGNVIAWLAAEHTTHQDAWTYAVLAVITAFLGFLAGRTVVVLARRQFLPRPDLTLQPKVTDSVLTVPAVRPGAAWLPQYRLVWSITLAGDGAPHSVRSSVVWASATSFAS
jgi:tellurite resistance protein